MTIPATRQQKRSTSNNRRRHILAVVCWTVLPSSTTAWAPTTTTAHRRIRSRAAATTTTSSTTTTTRLHYLVESSLAVMEAASAEVAAAASSSSSSSSSLVANAIMTSLDSFWQGSPYTAAAIACGVKASAADMVAQKKAASDLEEEVLSMEVELQQQQPASFLPFSQAPPQPQPDPTPLPTTIVATDYKRNAAFLLYGSLYQGVSQEFIYNHLYPVWFGTGQDIPTVLTKVAFDVTCQTTLVTLPVAYLIQGALLGSHPQASLRNYVSDIQHQGLLQKYVSLWGPVQCLTFGVVPEHYRVTFIAFVSFFWLIVLSQISSSSSSLSSSSSSSSTTDRLEGDEV